MRSSIVSAFFVVLASVTGSALAAPLEKRVQVSTCKTISTGILKTSTSLLDPLYHLCPTK